MSIFNRFTRAVRARVSHHTSRSLDEEADLDHLEPSKSPRAFAVGDRVVVQHDGVCEIVARRTMFLDERPLPVFEVRSRRGLRDVPEARAHALMRHVVSPEGAELARRLLFADQSVETSPAGLEVAWLKLDLGPEAQALRAMYPRLPTLNAQERAVFESVREVVCDELDLVLGLPPGTTQDALSSRFGAASPVI